jgi:hypothetical protein
VVGVPPCDSSSSSGVTTALSRLAAASRSRALSSFWPISAPVRSRASALPWVFRFWYWRFGAGSGLPIRIAWSVSAWLPICRSLRCSARSWALKRAPSFCPNWCRTLRISWPIDSASTWVGLLYSIASSWGYCDCQFIWRIAGPCSQ